MIKTTIITTIEIEAEVSADYLPGSGDYFDRTFGNYLPGDTPEIKNLKVTISKSNRTIDITDALPNRAISEIEEQIVEEYLRNGVA